MAKRPRMGRNLNALLGSTAKPRSTTPAVDAPDDTTVEVDKRAPVDDAEQTASTLSAANEPTKIVDPANVTRLSAVEPSAVEQSSVAPPGDVETAVERLDDSGLTDGSEDHLRMIGVDQIRRGTYQPRRLFDQELLQELAESIKAQGMIQPIIVRPFAGAYELVAGERRWRAAQLAGLARIPAIVRSMADQSVAAVALIENIQRKDLNPLEEAAAFERLCDEFGMTHKAVAESVGRSRASVTNLLRLLELHDEVKVLVDKGELEMGHARAILGAPKEQQLELARRCIKDGLTVRAVEKLVRELHQDPDFKPDRSSAALVDPDIERLSQKLGETLGAAVRIQHRGTGAGKLEISYSSVSELQGILAHIK